ncbi:MAG: substrate-binding domain-containing protein [Lachnospiraceae bacterium]|nr:substrate-binding domain-containing protein [Lachnospiraceae bacterium]
MRMNKNKKSRLLACLLISVLTLGMFSGCGASSSGSSSSSSGKILFVLPDVEDTFRASLADAIVSSAKELGVDLDYQESGSSVDNQKAIIEKAASDGYAGCICRLTDVNTALQMEVAAGDMPIVFVNNEPTEDLLKDSKYVYVGSPEKKAGEFEAEYVLNKLGKPSSMKLIMIKGEKGHSATEGRTKAVLNYLRDNGVDVNITFSDYANWSTETAYEYMGVAAKVGAKYDAVICNNDSMALGVVQYMQDNGISTKDIPVCGVDATEDGCASIAAGGIQFTVLQSATGQAQKAVEAIQAMGKGGSISDIEGASEDGKYIWVDFEKVDSSNVSDYR